MSESKNGRPQPGQNGSAGNGQDIHGPAMPSRARRSLAAANGKQVGGWDAYRAWLTQVKAPEKRRIPLDQSLYTWRGYRNWSEQVRRDWKQEE